MPTTFAPQIGQAVSIVVGSLAGVVGKLVGDTDSQWIVELQRGVLVKIDAANCEALPSGPFDSASEEV